MRTPPRVFLKPASPGSWLLLALVDHHVVNQPAYVSAATVIADVEPQPDLVVRLGIRREIYDRATPTSGDGTAIRAREGRLARDWIAVALGCSGQGHVVRVIDKVRRRDEFPWPAIHADFQIAAVIVRFGCQPVIERQPDFCHRDWDNNLRTVQMQHGGFIAAGGAGADILVWSIEGCARAVVRKAGNAHPLTRREVCRRSRVADRPANA